jgi:hypothetical protein
VPASSAAGDLVLAVELGSFTTYWAMKYAAMISPPQIAAWMPSKNCHQASSECWSASRTRAWVAASVAWRTTMWSPTGAVLRVGDLVDVPELDRLAAEPVVLLEPAREGPERAGNLALGREADRGRRLDERALLRRQLEPVDERAGRRQRPAFGQLAPRESQRLAEADEDLRVRAVASGDAARLFLVDALRELLALVGNGQFECIALTARGNSRT